MNSNRSNSSEKVKIKDRSGCKTRQEIAAEYGWSVQTLRTKLKANNIFLPSGLITPKWQKIIYEELGYPASVAKSQYEDV